MSHGSTARDLPELRADLVDWMRTPSGNDTMARYGGPDAAETGAALAASELFYVCADMAQMAIGAGEALPSYRLHREDLPAECGLVLWEIPVTDPPFLTDVPVIGAIWSQSGGGVNVLMLAETESWLRWMAAPDPVQGQQALTPAAVRELRKMRPTKVAPLGSSYLPFGEVPSWLARPSLPSELSLGQASRENDSRTFLEQAERALLVSWLLMGQTIIREERVQAPRAGEKRIRRIDPSLLTSTRYCTLRQRSLVPEARGEADGPSRQYAHRWIVRGHWRNHWYPARQDHRPIWIPTHVKGPDGAPILDPSKLVHVLRR